MKKVLIIGLSNNLGGVENVIFNFYKKFDRSKFSFCFLINDEEIPFSNEIIKNNDEIYKIHKRSKNIILYYKDIITFFKKRSNEFDIVWCNSCDLVNIEYLKMAKKYNIPKRIIHAHTSQNMSARYRNILHNLNKLKIKKYATDFWACSEKSGLYFYPKSVLSGTNYLIVNNAIDSNLFRYNINIRKKYRSDLKINNNIVIGNVGRLHFGKNQLFMLDILIELLKINSKYILVLVGDGEDKDRIEEKIRKYKLQEHVMLLGRRTDIYNILQSFDLFLFPSLFEGLPVSLIEAQASGIDILSSSEIYDKGYVFAKNIFFESLKLSPKKWARKINNIINLNNNRKYNSDSNINLIKKRNFDLKEETSVIEDIFVRE